MQTISQHESVRNPNLTFNRPRVRRVPRDYGHWHPIYREYGINTFPLAPLYPGDEKKPAVKHFNKMGARATTGLAQQPKFAVARALGYLTGRMNHLTVMDVDSASEKVLADRIDKHGEAKIVIRNSVSGHYQVPYAYNGEVRRIRPWKSGEPFDEVDILGDGGYAVAPPSRYETGGGYEIIHGHLDDLDQLKPMKNVDDLFCHLWDQIGTPNGVYPAPADYENYELASLAPEWAPYGTRNCKLWEHCMHQALHCTTFAQVLATATEHYATSCEQQPSMAEGELVKIARSAWKYTTEGRNWFGHQRGVTFGNDELDILTLPGYEYVLALLTRLKQTQGPHSTFCLTDSWADSLGWRRRDYKAARNYLVGTYIRQIRRPYPGRWALYRWINASRQPA